VDEVGDFEFSQWRASIEPTSRASFARGHSCGDFAGVDLLLFMDPPFFLVLDSG